MTVAALGYVVARAKDLGDWGSFGPGQLGLQRVDKSAKSLAFRMDDRKQRIIVDADGGEGISVFGWEVADAGALDALAARLEANGVQVAHGARTLADGHGLAGEHRFIDRALPVGDDAIDGDFLAGPNADAIARLDQFERHILFVAIGVDQPRRLRR